MSTHAHRFPGVRSPPAQPRPWPAWADGRGRTTNDLTGLTTRDRKNRAITLWYHANRSSRSLYGLQDVVSRRLIRQEAIERGWSASLRQSAQSAKSTTTKRNGRHAYGHEFHHASIELNMTTGPHGQ